MTTLLLVDDDVVYRRRLAQSFRARGIDVVEAADAGDAVAAFERRPTHLAVLDVRMPGESGIELLRSLRSRAPTLRVVILTGWGSIPSAVEAVRIGAVDYLTKPADADEILAALNGERVRPDLDAPSLDRVQWEHIQRVLHAREGNISQTARALGIQRRSLQRKLGKLPLAR